MAITSPATHHLSGDVLERQTQGTAVSIAPPITAQSSASSPATHRRRSRWFELNPGCFGRAAFLAAGVGAAAAACGGVLWWVLRVRRGSSVR